jgi:hypothetical protein
MTSRLWGVAGRRELSTSHSYCCKLQFHGVSFLVWITDKKPKMSDNLLSYYPLCIIQKLSKHVFDENDVAWPLFPSLPWPHLEVLHHCLAMIDSWSSSTLLLGCRRGGGSAPPAVSVGGMNILLSCSSYNTVFKILQAMGPIVVTHKCPSSSITKCWLAMLCHFGSTFTNLTMHKPVGMVFLPYWLLAGIPLSAWGLASSPQPATSKNDNQQPARMTFLPCSCYYLLIPDLAYPAPLLPQQTLL